ncbi:MAG TPA: hypothetical protein VGN07_03785 [Steroidobacteraceae bacterium]
MREIFRTLLEYVVGPARVIRLLAAASIATMAAACAPLQHYEVRAAHSSLGCMNAAIKDQQLESIPDWQAHCIAAGLIARHCSVTEAGMASVGKELKDLFGHGDAEWRDLQSDRRGIGCARTAATDTELRSCCVTRQQPAVENSPADPATPLG